MTGYLIKSQRHNFFIYCSGPSCSKGGNTIHWINPYSVDNAIIGFLDTYPLYSDLSSGYSAI